MDYGCEDTLFYSYVHCTVLYIVSVVVRVINCTWKKLFVVGWFCSRGGAGLFDDQTVCDSCFLYSDY